ncbi:MAG: phosphoadenosine phosphosulfate reductase [Rhodobacteraceae bacterium]|nr:phosphoadenosine phosphosulfate reductase [Paracoccaceae bacterium]
MSDHTRTSDASDAESREDWLARMDEIGEEAGYFEPLGRDHWAFFVDESPTLIVTFETLDGIRDADGDQMPIGHHVARAQGWSHLCLITGKDDWYRDPAVYGYFDRLIDDAFFEDFDRVVFFGAGMCAYAAAAFSVAAPGATVILSAPHATLDPRLIGWDPRFRAQRRMNFNDRYGYAPDMTEGAGDVFLMFDPDSALDAMHAALFHRPYVIPIRVPGFGNDPSQMMQKMGILQPLLTLAGRGKLTAGAFYRALRARHNNMAYLRGLLMRANRRKTTAMAARVCRAVLRNHNAPRFRRRLAAIEAGEGATGRSDPAQTQG